MKNIFTSIKEGIEEVKSAFTHFFNPDGDISSKRVFALMIFTNAIVLSYLGDKTELINSFLNTGVLLAGVTVGEKILHKKDKEDNEK